MAITTVADIIPGLQYVVDFMKVTAAALVAGRPYSYWLNAGLPSPEIIQSNIQINTSSIANPSVITTNSAHGYTTGDQISINGHGGSTPAIDGNHTITVTDTTHFTIPVNVTANGTGGYANCFNPGGSGTPGLKGKALTNFTTGQLPFLDPVSGNSYLARFQARVSANPGTLLLCDRLWHNTGISTGVSMLDPTIEQVFTDSAQIPARDANGTNNGVGVFAAAEIHYATGVNAPTLTFKYTDQDGNAGITTTTIAATVASSAVGTFYIFSLAAGDTGVRKAESLTQSVTWTSGQYGIVLFRVIARLEIFNSLVPTGIDAFMSGFPRMYNGTVPFLVYIPNTTTALTLLGHSIWTQG